MLHRGSDGLAHLSFRRLHKVFVTPLTSMKDKETVIPSQAHAVKTCRLSVGRNPGSPVSQLYGLPFAFTGTIFKVIADTSGRSLQDPHEERHALARQAMARQ
jgi:hypothetical protein